MAKENWDGEEFVLMRYTPAALPEYLKNLSRVDAPETEENKRMIAKLPHNSVVGHLHFLNTCTHPDLTYVLSKLS